MTFDSSDPGSRGVPVFGAVMTLFGLHVMEFGLGDYIPTRVFLRAIEPLRINAPAIRAMLRRATEKGLLRERKVGREVHYALTENGMTLARQGRGRVYDPDALTHAAGEWTLLTIPEGPALRNERYQMKIRLAWAGFARLMPNVWVTPGRFDADAMLADAFEGNPPADALAFLASPLDASSVARMIARVWDIAAIRRQHEHFLKQWEKPAIDKANPLPELLRLINAWGDLLLEDPGLPAQDLPHPWPAQRSTAAFARAQKLLWEPAREQLGNM